METGGLKGRREMLRRKVKAELTDVHAHILPGVDDGAESLEEAFREIPFTKIPGGAGDRF